jgi:hypothetical protein
MSPRATEAALQRLGAPLRLLAGAGWSALGLGAAVLSLGLAAWSVRLGWVDAPWWVLAAWVAALAILCGIGWIAWRDR